MAIELSNLTFTDEDDIVPAFGVEEIVNTGITNTFGGNDIITGFGGRFSFLNYGVLNTGDGDDILTGSRDLNEFPERGGAGFRTYGSPFNTGEPYDSIIDTGSGNDIITGIAKRGVGILVTFGSTINTGDGNDTITGTATDSGIKIDNLGTIDTGNGNDIISGTGFFGFDNSSTFNTGDGNDIITGTDTTGGGYGIYNAIYEFTVNFSDSITINTGDGDDTITGIGGIGIYNDETIDTGNGADSIIAAGGFGGSGKVFLRNGKDYLKGFGSGNFNGGNGKDTLELTSGSYTVEISGTSLKFTKDSITMNTSEFDILKAGNTIYNCDNLINGQIIVVA